MTNPTARTHRRVVTGHREGKAVILSDERRPPYRFRTNPGFEQSYVWAASGIAEADPATVDATVETSALPAAGGSLVHIVTFPPSAASAESHFNPMEIGQEYLARLPGLAETFEHDGSQMHATNTLDYAIILDGDLWLEMDDAKIVKLSPGDVIVQQATRHGWRNHGDKPATIAFIMLGPTT
jgi:hypothetical protein